MPTFVVPNSFGSVPLREFNDCHEPGGSGKGGRFCSGSGGALERIGATEGKRVDYQLRKDGESIGRIKKQRQRDPMVGGPQTYNTTWHAKRGPYDTGSNFSTQQAAEEWLLRGRSPDAEDLASFPSAGARAAAKGEIYDAQPAEFQKALRKNARADTLSDYSEDDLRQFRLYMLKGGEAGYAIKPDGEFVNLFNNGGPATKGAGPWLVLHAIERGASHGDHFDGFLTGFYRKLGFVETKREKNWTPGGPDVIYMRFAGDRKKAREQYRKTGQVAPIGAFP